MTAKRRVEIPESVELVRPLGPHERFFWTYDKVKLFNFSVVVSFTGTMETAQWKSALAQIQKKHPLLNVSINGDDPHAPTFMRAPGLPIPFTVEPRTSSTQWQRVVEREISEPFAASTAPLLRADLLQDEKGCDLVLTAHHSISDGISMAALFGDLLAALAGDTLPSLPVPPCAEDRMAQLKASGHFPAAPVAPQHEPETIPAADAAPARPARSFAVGKHTGHPTIDALRFSPEQTTQFLRCSRQRQTTVGSVILAAMASALRSLSTALEEADIYLFIPVDARAYLQNQADLILAISSAGAVSHYPDPDLWASARALRTQLAPFQCFAEIDASYARVQAVMAMNLEPSVLVEAIAQRVGCDVLLSNLKNVEFPRVPAGLTIDAVWGPSVLMGIQGEQMIGASTFNGALHLLYTTHSPLPGLLETVRHLITSACEDS